MSESKVLYGAEKFPVAVGTKGDSKVHKLKLYEVAIVGEHEFECHFDEQRGPDGDFVYSKDGQEYMLIVDGNFMTTPDGRLVFGNAVIPTPSKKAIDAFQGKREQQ